MCDDGVTIAKEVELKDPEQNLGAQMVREAAERTGEAVGDGTTTSTLLAPAAVDTIKGLSRPLACKREKAQVATISAHNDAAIGDIVADAVEKWALTE